MKILHIIPNEKFTESFITFINKNFNHKQHTFVTYGNNKTYTVKKRDNVNELTKSIKSINFLIKSLYESEKIIIHGLFNLYIVLMLFLQPWLLKKSYWVIWGGDLYYHVMRVKTIKSNIYEYLRKNIIKKMVGLITHIKGDYDLVIDWYGARGKYYYSFMYPSNLFKNYDNISFAKCNDILVIQIGNSADTSNNHIEVLDGLRRFKDKNIKIVCPLSYGDLEYSSSVIELGKSIYGNKFIPITEFLPFEKYIELLGNIDIAIFNHKRQQAMGNITTLLGLGKKVYIREEITTWQFCLDNNLKVYSANSDFDDLFEEIDEGIKQKNIENVKIQFSEEKLIEDLRKIFNEEVNR